MRKYALIGASIVAVVLLVLGSLTNVVGYQSVQTSGMNESPLYSIRTKRAINQASGDILTSDYLGKGKENLLQFPMRKNTTEQLKKAIEIISKMDDKTFEWFTELCIQKARQNDTHQDLSHYQIVQALLLLKTNPDAVINSYTIRNNQEGPTMATYCAAHTMCGAWFPGCWIITIVEVIIVLILYPFIVILDSITSKLTIRTQQCVTAVCSPVLS